MKQKIVAKINNRVETFELPSPEEEVLPGVCWGNHIHLFTPAFWKVLSKIQQENFNTNSYKIGDDLTEEVAACLLGGYGIPSQVGLAAFYRVKDAGLLGGTPSEDQIAQILAEPLNIGARQVRYRFVRQKSRYLNRALKKIAAESSPRNALEFRSWLMEFEGIGYKTASWITRNWLHSDDVAIIDVHIQRAGLLMNLYNSNQIPSKHYLEMEEKFLCFAAGIDIKASQLDVLIWEGMKYAGNVALNYVNQTFSH